MIIKFFILPLQPSNNFVYVLFLLFALKIDKKEEDEPSTSANPVLELELTEEKLPMTLSRQEVSEDFYFPLSIFPHYILNGIFLCSCR